MIPRTPLPPELLLLAGRQARTLSREQLLGHGVSDRVIQRLLADGRLDRMAQGIYATGEGGWLQLAWAVCSSAAHGLSLVARRRATCWVCLRGHTRRTGTRAHAQLATATGSRGWKLVRSPRQGSGEPPRTRLAQTVVDLAAAMDADDIVAVVRRGRGSQAGAARGDRSAARGDLAAPASGVSSRISSARWPLGSQAARGALRPDRRARSRAAGREPSAEPAQRLPGRRLVQRVRRHRRARWAGLPPWPDGARRHGS